METLKKSQLLIFLWLVILFFPGCSSEKDEIRILVIGDVQLKSNIRKYFESDWKVQQLDTQAFQHQFKEVLSKQKPHYIFQTGDWVNYNDNMRLHISDTLGNVIKRLPLPYSEWDFMNAQIPDSLYDKFYIARGNHESYGEVKISGIFHPDYDILGNVNSEVNLLKPNTGKAQLTEKFPHLKTASFLGSTGTYFKANKHFALLSIDGLDKERDRLMNFVETNLGKAIEKAPERPIFVISHYPVFTGLPKEKDSTRVLFDIREPLIECFDRYGVKLFANGHEHFYLRYSPEEKLRYFEKPHPKHTEYLTVSDFANPYSRDFKRFGPELKPVHYFKGSHYLLIRVTDQKLAFEVYGLNNDSGEWSLIDQFAH